MRVVKRSGKIEEIKFDKIIQRIKSLSKDLNLDPGYLAQRTIRGLHDEISTAAIDKFLAETAATLSGEHYNYARLAARIAVSSLHKETDSSFYQTTKLLYKKGILSQKYLDKVKENVDEIEGLIDYSRDFTFDFFGFKTLEKGYLLRIGDKVIERPQHLFMRVAIGVAKDFAGIKELYEYLSLGYYTHATPTLFNAGTKRPQLSSCFLQALEDDSIEGIFNTLKDTALISKYAGGVGLHIHNIRARGSHIQGTNGKSSGIVPFIKIFNETARAVDQAGRRKGSFAMYLEPWHADVEQFLQLKKPTGKEELRARDIFLAMWIPDLFMQRVEKDQEWTLMCPNEQPGLADVYGEEFEKLYTKYEQENPQLRRVKARDLMSRMIESMLESGVPYMCFKDACNKKSNQKNIGVIKSSNLCVEIMEVSTPGETAVCNLASVCLPKFIKKNNSGFDFAKLKEVTKVAVRNLNAVVDSSFYPTSKAKSSNLRHRPIGLGVQGLGDVFCALNMPYESEQAKDLDRAIFAHMYFAALEASCDLAEKDGPYKTFEGSPASEGQLQFDLWGVEPFDLPWDKLKERIKKVGLRNSLLMALMPTASTSQIFGNTECFEMVTSNLYKRQTLAGEFVVINKYLVAELERQGLWSAEMREKIINGNGSIQHIKEIPYSVRDVYKTIWEIKQKEVIDHAAIRAPYVCQSQSMNLFFDDASYGKVNSAIYYAWKKGLKTGSYYTRTKAAVDAVKVTTQIAPSPTESIACSLENPESCEACQ